MSGIEQFPLSVEVKTAYAVFMISRARDMQSLSVTLSRARRMNPSLEIQYILHCVDHQRKKLVELVDGGLEQIISKLKLAARYQEECKKWIRAFWGHLSKEEDLGQLAEIVVYIERSEKQAETIYRKLLARYPKSVRVLRAYGVFLEEIKNDIELSQLAFRTSDDLEEELAKKTVKKSNIFA